jgi:hypothetical protein
MYRQLNWVNQRGVDICVSPTVHCDGYGRRGVTPYTYVDICGYRQDSILGPALG